jgi:hypothetical protein
MLLSFLKTVQKRRIAAQNFRVLSALDDETLHDIGLDRRTLQTFCENGCTYNPALPRQPAASRRPVAPGALRAAFR